MELIKTTKPMEWDKAPKTYSNKFNQYNKTSKNLRATKCSCKGKSHNKVLWYQPRTKLLSYTQTNID